MDLGEAVRAQLTALSSHLEGALVYVDAGAAEALGSLQLLLNLGAANVCSLEDARPEDATVSLSAAAPAGPRGLAVLLAGPLPASRRPLLAALRLHPGLLRRRCSLFCGLTEEAHGPGMEDVYAECAAWLEEELTSAVAAHEASESAPAAGAAGAEGERGREQDREQDPAAAASASAASGGDGWEDTSFDAGGSGGSDAESPSPSGSPRGAGAGAAAAGRGGPSSAASALRVHIAHLPLPYVTLSPWAFVLPANGPASDLAARSGLGVYPASAMEPGRFPSGGGAAAGAGAGDAAGAPRPSGGGEGARAAASAALAAALADVGALLSLRLTPLALGPAAQALAKQVAAAVNLTPGSSAWPSGVLVLVDRACDLATPAGHGDALLDRMLEAAPRLGDNGSAAPGLGGGGAGEDGSEGGRDAAGVGIASGRPLGPRPAAASFCAPARALPGPLAAMAWPAPLPPVFFPAADKKAAGWLETLLLRRTRDGALQLRRWLMELVKKAGGAGGERALPDAPGGAAGAGAGTRGTRGAGAAGGGVKLGAVSAAEVAGLVADVAREARGGALKARGLLAIAAAAADALGPAAAARWEALAAAERAIAAAAAADAAAGGDGGGALAAQLVDLVSSAGRAAGHQSGRPGAGPTVAAAGRAGAPPLISLRDALTLAAVGYAAAGECRAAAGGPAGTGAGADGGGPLTWDDEKQLEDAIAEALLIGEPAEPLARGFVGAELTADLRRLWRAAAHGAKAAVEGAGGGRSGGAEEDDEDDEGGDLSFERARVKRALRDRVRAALGRWAAALAAVRPALAKLPPPAGAGAATAGGGRPPLLRRLAGRLRARAAMPELEAVPAAGAAAVGVAALGGFLKTGLGRLGLRSGPAADAKPAVGPDTRAVVLFVLGGIGPSELREAYEAWAEAAASEAALAAAAAAAAPGAAGAPSAGPAAGGPTLLVGGTTLLGPAAMHELLLGGA